MRQACGTATVYTRHVAQSVLYPRGVRLSLPPWEMTMHIQDMEQEGGKDMAIRVVMSGQPLEDLNYMNRPELRGKNLFDLTSWVAVVTAPGKGSVGRWP